MPDFEICECGDYRHQHKDGEGPCDLNGLGHGGAPACGKFRPVEVQISCNSHERIYEDGSGYICRNCGADMDPDFYDED